MERDTPGIAAWRHPRKGERTVAALLLGLTIATGFAVQGAVKPVAGSAVASAEALPAMTERYKMNRIVEGLANEIGGLYMQAEASGGSKMAGMSRNLAGGTTSYTYGYSKEASVEANTAAEIPMGKSEGNYDLSVSYVTTGADGAVLAPIVGIDVQTGVRGKATMDYGQTYSLHIRRTPTEPGQWAFSVSSGGSESTANPSWYANFSFGPDTDGDVPNTVQSVDDLAPYVVQARQVIQSAVNGAPVGYLPEPK